MYDNDSKGISYTGGFFMLIAFMIAGAVLAAQLSQLIWSLGGGDDYLKIRQNTTHSQHAMAIKLGQVLTSVVGFFFLPWLLPGCLTGAPSNCWVLPQNQPGSRPFIQY